MTTVYVAAEKLMTWAQDGRMSVNESLIDTLRTHCKNNRFVVFFAPVRFGLWFDGRNEVEDAWQYMARVLKAAGFQPADVFLFDEDIEISKFQNDLKKQDERQSAAIIFSESAQDEGLAQVLNIRKVSEIPANISNMWQKIDIRRAFRTFVAAAIQP